MYLLQFLLKAYLTVILNEKSQNGWQKGWGDLDKDFLYSYSYLSTLAPVNGSVSYRHGTCPDTFSFNHVIYVDRATP